MKNITLICGLLASLAFGCNRDDDDHGDGPYLVSIDIQSPADGAVVAAGQPMPIKVVFNRENGQTIHHVNVYVASQTNVILDTLFVQHAHVPGEFTYESNDYTPAQPGHFKIQAVTTDDAEESPNLEEAEFEVQ